MPSFPEINGHLVRSVAKAALKSKGLPKEDLGDMIDFVRLVLVTERKYYKKSEARAVKAVLAAGTDAV